MKAKTILLTLLASIAVSAIAVTACSKEIPDYGWDNEIEYDYMGPNTGNMRKYKYEDIYGNEFTYYIGENTSAEGRAAMIKVEADRGMFKSDRNDQHIVTLGIEHRTQSGSVEKAYTVKASLSDRDCDECWITDYAIVNDIWQWLSSGPMNSVTITADRNRPYSDFKMTVESR